MSKPRYRWWGFARKMIRDYPGLRDAVDDLPDDDRKVYDAVTEAIEITKLRPDGVERIAMIRFIYWGRKQNSVKDAALHIHVSQRTAERWHSAFVRLVGKCYGFNVGGLEPK